MKFGPLTVIWLHKYESKCRPKGLRVSPISCRTFSTPADQKLPQRGGPITCSIHKLRKEDRNVIEFVECSENCHR